MYLRLIVTALASITALGAWGDNAQFQSHFFSVCSNATEQLAARCAETQGGLGDLSGDSESSLNPSQILAGGDGGLAAARAADEQARDRADRLGRANEDSDDLGVGPFSLLFNVRGDFEDFDRQVDIDAERGYEVDTFGVELGLDYRIGSRTLIGVLAIWESSSAEFDRERSSAGFQPTASAGEMDTRRIGATAFAVREFGDSAYVQGSVGYLSAEIDASRNAVFLESTRSVPQTNVRTRADIDGEDTFAALQWGYQAELGGWTLSPYAGLLYSRSEVDAYSERDTSNSGLALAVDGYERESLLATGGLRVGRGFSLSQGIVLPELRLEYAHEFDRDAETARSRFLLDGASNVLTLENDRPDRSYGNLGLSVLFVLPNGWMPFIDYQLTIGQRNVDRGRVAAGLRREL